MCDKCEHDDRVPDPLTSYLTEILPVAPTEVLENILNMSVTELFIRTPKGKFQDMLFDFSTRMLEAFDENEHPEMMAPVFKERDRNLAHAEEHNMEAQGTEELSAILNQQGVLDDDQAYGNYL